MKTFIAISFAVLSGALIFSGCSMAALQFADVLNKPGAELDTATAKLGLQGAMVEGEKGIRLEWNAFEEPVKEGYTILLSETSPWEDFQPANTVWHDTSYEGNWGRSFDPGDIYYFRLSFEVERSRNYGLDDVTTRYISEAVAVEVE
jgi:hypothetical protein